MIWVHKKMMMMMITAPGKSWMYSLYHRLAMLTKLIFFLKKNWEKEHKHVEWSIRKRISFFYKYFFGGIIQLLLPRHRKRRSSYLLLPLLFLLGKPVFFFVMTLVNWWKKSYMTLTLIIMVCCTYVTHVYPVPLIWSLVVSRKMLNSFFLYSSLQLAIWRGYDDDDDNGLRFRLWNFCCVVLCYKS